MNTSKKRIIITLMVFCIYFFNDCLADDEESCEQTIYRVFHQCITCDEGPEYVRYIAKFLVYDEIENPVVKEFIDYFFPSVLVAYSSMSGVEYPRHPVMFCNNEYNGDIEHCKDVLAVHPALDKQWVLDRLRFVYYNMSITNILDKPEYEKVPLLRYMDHATKYIEIDKRRLSSGETAESYCRHRACTKDINLVFKNCPDCLNCNSETQLEVFIEYIFDYIVVAEIEQNSPAYNYTKYIFSLIEATRQSDARSYCTDISNRYTTKNKRNQRLERDLIVNICLRLLMNAGFPASTVSSRPSFYPAFAIPGVFGTKSDHLFHVFFNLSVDSKLEESTIGFSQGMERLYGIPEIKNLLNNVVMNYVSRMKNEYKTSEYPKLGICPLDYCKKNGYL